ncbi:MAG: membrane protein insertase YidC, partial [Alphaproteobacteria bacterium]|nr:membrane protein insertase YidC [Alphaproteobacteria bacterium]
MMDQKNLLLAIVLSVAILFGFQWAFERFLPHPSPNQTAPTLPAAQPAPGAANPAPAAEAPAGGTAPAGAASTALAATREAAIADQPRVRIDTPRLHGSVTLTGARIDDLTLANYHETVDPKSPEVILLWPTGTQDPYFAAFGWVGPAGADIKLPDSDSKWTPSGGPLAPGRPLTLSWDNGAGLSFTRNISIDENYMFTIDETVKNGGSAEVTLTPYALISRTGTPNVAGYYILHEGLIGDLDGSLKETKYSALAPGKPEEFSSTTGWLGFTDKYWLAALVPQQGTAFKAQFRHTVDANKIDRYQADYTGAPLTVPAGGTASNATRFFGGAKEFDLLRAYEASGIPHFDLAIDFGWFWFLTKPIFMILQYFYGLLGNFG